MNRVALVSGLRTPFCKAGSHFQDIHFQDLSAELLKIFVAQEKIDTSTLDRVVWGTVLLDPRTPNWAREIVFRAGLPRTVYAQSISNNCISGLIAAIDIADSIANGRMRSGIAGGTELMSFPTLTYSDSITTFFLKLAKARSMKDKLALLPTFRPLDLLPKPPGVTEPSTGLTMGEHMEITAKSMRILRKDQDEIALRSHQNAAKAIQNGIFAQEVTPVFGLSKDTLVRADTSFEKLSSLKPVFDRSPKGTLTAGNSSALTDGAAAVLLMSEDEAKRQGREILAFVADYELSALDPNDGLLMAPTLAVPKLLKRNGLRLENLDRIEIHEAFAAQVMANVSAWENGITIAGETITSIGKLDWDKTNVHGGSIALGHPFSATGGRIMTTLGNELKRNNLQKGLISVCAAGGMACALLLDR